VVGDLAGHEDRFVAGAPRCTPLAWSAAPSMDEGGALHAKGSWGGKTVVENCT
jgi:hypothetical protein